MFKLPLALWHTKVFSGFHFSRSCVPKLTIMMPWPLLGLQTPKTFTTAYQLEQVCICYELLKLLLSIHLKVNYDTTRPLKTHLG